MTNMKTILTWKKGIFANTYNIYSDGKLIGKMKNNCFSQSDDGELNVADVYCSINSCFCSNLDYYIELKRKEFSLMNGKIRI